MLTKFDSILLLLLLLSDVTGYGLDTVSEFTPWKVAASEELAQGP